MEQRDLNLALLERSSAAPGPVQVEAGASRVKPALQAFMAENAARYADPDFRRAVTAKIPLARPGRPEDASCATRGWRPDASRPVGTATPADRLQAQTAWSQATLARIGDTPLSQIESLAA